VLFRSGFVYNDLDDDGIQETASGEQGIGGVTITLTGTTGSGEFVTKTTTTSSNGAYSFSGLQPGTYTVTESQPAGYADGKDTLGTVNGVTRGIASDNVLANVTLTCANQGINYNFGELGIYHGLTATIGFWHNQNGQSLINSFGKTASGYTLANWLATSFPNLFGKNAAAYSTSSTIGINLTGRSNAEVAAYFLKLFDVTGPKTYAQVLATAFSVFTTTNSLNTATTSRALATKFGFTLSTNGAAAASYNIGTTGDAFHLADNSTVTVGKLLQQVNAYAVKGVLCGGNQAQISEINAAFSDINQKGDIIT